VYPPSRLKPAIRTWRRTSFTQNTEIEERRGLQSRLTVKTLSNSFVEGGLPSDAPAEF
jgi:hypothetical protein